MSVVNVAGFPTHIIHASIESMMVSSWVEIQVRNSLAEPVEALRFRILKYSNSKVIETTDGIITDPVQTGIHRYRTYVETTLDQGTQAVLVVTKVRTKSGVWFTEPSAPNKVTYESNISLTAEEKTEILGVVLNQLARDPNQEQFFGNSHRLLLWRENCDYAVPLSDAGSIETLSFDAIQAIADREQRAVYIRCGGFDIEGSRVKLHLILNDRLARGRNPIRIPFRYNFEFVLLKNGGKWVVEKFNGYT